MKDRNWKLEIDHHQNDEGFGTISWKGKTDLLFQFTFDINTRSHCVQGRFDDIDVKLHSFEFDDERNHKVQINERNTTFLCNLIAEIINEDVTAFGFDFDEHDDLIFDDEPCTYSYFHSRVHDL
jgi:hypothetical protein